jgi:tetratricopeptide (TPR) repeat protein
MDVWGALQYVGTGLSLVAFVVAAILFAYRARLIQRAELIKSAPEEERLEAIATTAEFFRVDVSGLTRAQQQEIALTQIHARARRDLLLAGVSLAVAILLAAIAITSIWASKAAGPATVVNASGPVFAPGRDANFKGPVNFGLDEKKVVQRIAEAQKPLDDKIDELKALLVQQLVAASPAQAAPGREQAVGTAIEDIAKGAAAGDDRLQQALDLLKAGKVEDASRLLQAFADDKSARIKQDSKEAATAWRNLGAIAGLADPKRAREAYGRAVALDPDDREALYWHGWLQLLAGDLGLADRDLDRLLQVSVAAHDDRGTYRAYLRLGQVFVARGNSEAAREYEDHAYDLAKRNAERSPDDQQWQRNLSVSNELLGDVYLAQGNLRAALEQYRASLTRMIPIRDADPSNMNLQRFTSVTFNKVGDVLVAQGNLPEALKSFRDGLAIADRLAKADPGNASWQRDLSVSYEKVGDVLKAQGNLPEALKSYNDDRAIMERLAKADPGNAGWQYDLGISNERIGDVLMDQGNLADALNSYQAKHDIISRLAKADPGNASWQRDLSVSYEKVGDVLKAQGNLPEALKSYRDSLAIRDRLAKADPGNASWQRDLAISHSKLASTFRKIGDTANALDALQRGRVILMRLTIQSPDHAGWRNDLAWFDGQIADLRQSPLQPVHAGGSARSRARSRPR